MRRFAFFILLCTFVCVSADEVNEKRIYFRILDPEGKELRECEIHVVSTIHVRSKDNPRQIVLKKTQENLVYFDGVWSIKDNGAVLTEITIAKQGYVSGEYAFTFSSKKHHFNEDAAMACVLWPIDPKSTVRKYHGKLNMFGGGLNFNSKYILSFDDDDIQLRLMGDDDEDLANALIVEPVCPIEAFQNNGTADGKVVWGVRLTMPGGGLIEINDPIQFNNAHGIREKTRLAESISEGGWWESSRKSFIGRAEDYMCKFDVSVRAEFTADLGHCLVRFHSMTVSDGDSLYWDGKEKVRTIKLQNADP